MENKLRNPAYIKIMHSIKSCKTIPQLETLRSLIHKYNYKNKDGEELVGAFALKQKELSEPLTIGYPEEEILNIYHKKLEAK